MSKHKEVEAFQCFPRHILTSLFLSSVFIFKMMTALSVLTFQFSPKIITVVTKMRLSFLNFNQGGSGQKLLLLNSVQVHKHVN